jgi:hypothetical protein
LSAVCFEIGKQQLSLSALPPKADIRQRIDHVCFVPLADIAITSRGSDLALELAVGIGVVYARMLTLASA